MLRKWEARGRGGPERRGHFGAARTVGAATRLLAVLTIVCMLTASSPAAHAAIVTCERSITEPPIVAASDDPRTTTLPPAFRVEPWPVDRVALVAETQRQVAAALADLEAAPCFTEALPNIAARTVFLSPFEYLVVSYYERDHATRDRLLQLYRQDPELALRQIITIWPSTRAEMLVRASGHFDIDAGQIFVNRGKVTPDDVGNVLVHEFWHALVQVRFATRADGSQSRTTGFWRQDRYAGEQEWRAVDEVLENGTPTYLMNEATAIEMEEAITGHLHPRKRADLEAALDTLHALFHVAGREQVIRLYLESRSDELKLIAREARLLAAR